MKFAIFLILLHYMACIYMSLSIFSWNVFLLFCRFGVLVWYVFIIILFVCFQLQSRQNDGTSFLVQEVCVIGLLPSGQAVRISSGCRGFYPVHRQFAVSHVSLSFAILFSEEVVSCGCSLNPPSSAFMLTSFSPALFHFVREYSPHIIVPFLLFPFWYLCHISN